MVRNNYIKNKIPLVYKGTEGTNALFAMLVQNEDPQKIAQTVVATQDEHMINRCTNFVLANLTNENGPRNKLLLAKIYFSLIKSLNIDVITAPEYQLQLKLNTIYSSKNLQGQEFELIKHILKEPNDSFNIVMQEFFSNKLIHPSWWRLPQSMMEERFKNGIQKVEDYFNIYERNLEQKEFLSSICSLMLVNISNNIKLRMGERNEDASDMATFNDQVQKLEKLKRQADKQIKMIIKPDINEIFEYFVICSNQEEKPADAHHPLRFFSEELDKDVADHIAGYYAYNELLGTSQVSEESAD